MVVVVVFELFLSSIFDGLRKKIVRKVGLLIVVKRKTIQVYVDEKKIENSVRCQYSLVPS